MKYSRHSERLLLQDWLNVLSKVSREGNIAGRYRFWHKKAMVEGSSWQNTVEAVVI